MPPTITNVAAAPPTATTAAALSKTFSFPSSFAPSSTSFSSSCSSFISSSFLPSSSIASGTPPQPTIIDNRLDPRSFFWPSVSSWPTSYEAGNFYSYYCPPGVTYFGCRISVPVTTPVASATAVGPPPPPPVSTSADPSLPVVSAASTTLVVIQTSVASTTETVTSPATDAGSTASTPTRSGSPATTLLTMSSTSSNFSALPTSSGTASASDNNSSLTNRTTVVILSSVLSVVGIVAVAGLVFICCRFRQRRGGSFFPRGISPIDDDEIETWKGARDLPETSENEKGPSGLLGAPAGDHNGPDSPPLLSAGALGAGATVQRRDLRPRTHSYPERGVSLDSSGITTTGGGASMEPRPVPPPKKTLSNVIVYKDPPQPFPGLPNSASSTIGFPPIPSMPAVPAATAAGAAAINYLQQQQQQQTVPLYRRSEEFSPRSTRSMSFGYPASRGMAGRFSFDQDRDFLFSQALASPSSQPTALQHARAPNSRAGLTDEAVPGDPSFLPTPKRQPSRLLKMPPATGSPSATAEATAAAATGGAGLIFSPRWNSHSASGSSHLPSPPGNISSNSNSNSNSAAYWHARTRSARSCSTVSYAGSEAPLNQSFGQMSHQRRPSVVQYQPMYRPQVLTPPQQSPTSILHMQLPVPPLPVSTRPSSNNGGSENIRRRSSHSMYHEYLHQGKQPREASSSSTLASSEASSSIPPQMFSSGATAAAGASDDSDGPLLGGLSPPRARLPDSPPAVHERRSSSLVHLETIGRAIG